MCIAIYKPVGVKAPTIDTLKTCFTNNPDGAGFMMRLADGVHIRKGFMTFDDFKNGYDKFIAKYNINVEETDIVYHFRITTQGGVSKGLCHPYPVCDDYSTMKATSVHTSLALVHNGIIHITSNHKVKDHNDTMEFAKDYILPLVKAFPKWWDNNVFSNIITECSASKIVLMDNKHVRTYGWGWHIEKGIYYSNYSYMPKQAYAWKKPSWSPYKSKSAITYQNEGVIDDDMLTDEEWASIYGER